VLTVLAILGVLAVLFAAGVVATREGPILADARPDVADLDLPAEGLQPEDVREVRFGLAVRGYRMSEVDEVLDRLATALAERDARIATLEHPSPTDPTPPPPAPEPLSPPEPPLHPTPQPIEPVVPPPTDVAMVPVEVAPLPERPAGETEDAHRD